MTVDLDDGPAHLSPKQARSILDATARDNIWEGSVRSGKTIASIIAWLKFCALDSPRDGRLVMIGKTKDTLYRNVLTVIEEMLTTADWSHTKGANTATLFGREVDIIGANDVGAETKIRGLTVAGAYVDEATLLPALNYWLQLGNRMSLPGSRRFSTTNPDGPMHWLKADVLDRADELGVRTWHFTLDDNPGLTEAYKDQIKAENTGLWYQRNVLGLWVLAEGTIWDMWDEDRHIVDQLPRLGACSMTIDYGTAGVFVAQVLGIGIDPTDHLERLYVAREWRWDAKAKRRQLTDADYSIELRRWLDTEVIPAVPGAADLERIYVDPSATSFITQMHRDRWDRVRGADNAVADGIREVATLLSADRLRVHGSVKGLRDEVPGYVWDEKKAQKGEDAPVKANDHSCDALRYGVRGNAKHWRRWVSSVPLAEAA